MSKKRRRFAAVFIACVALAVLSGEHTISGLASMYGFHINQISQWKKQVKGSHFWYPYSEQTRSGLFVVKKKPPYLRAIF